MIERSEPRDGGMPLPRQAQIVPLEAPRGRGMRRKLSLLTRLPYYLPMIIQHVREADVVHVPLPGDIDFFGMLAALLLRKRLIVRYCGSWVTTSETTLMNRLLRFCMRLIVGEKNVLLATGESDVPPAPGIHWIFATALSCSELQGIRSEMERGLSTQPNVIYAGRLSREKGVRYLIEAIDLLKKQGFTPLPIVTLAGDGVERTQLEAKVKKLGCGGSVVFAGQLNRDELSLCFRRADLCVQPSLTEAYSKTWLDALAHGLPVLASEVGAARVVLGAKGERGWLVPPGDVKTLATVLARLLSDPIDWPLLRRNCRAFVEGRTLEAWAQRIGQLCVAQWNLSLKEGKLCTRD
jgi:glycosyltransferase involved in cell wall biosynthesis